MGTLGTALVLGLLKSGMVKPEQIKATVGHAETVRTAQKRLNSQSNQNVHISTDNILAIKDADIVILAVKPQNMPDLLKTIAPALNKNQLVVSVAAAIPLAFLEKMLAKGTPVIRAMPNTCLLVGAGMTGLAASHSVKEDHKKLVETIFKSMGAAIFLDEKLFDTLTALSASGPAYLYVVIESLTEAGVKLGMARETAALLVGQTMLGTAKMVLETGEHPALLKDAVTTPAGCTIDGLMELEEGKLRVTLIKAVIKAAERAAEKTKELPIS